MFPVAGATACPRHAVGHLMRPEAVEAASFGSYNVPTAFRVGDGRALLWMVWMLAEKTWAWLRITGTLRWRATLYSLCSRGEVHGREWRRGFFVERGVGLENFDLLLQSQQMWRDLPIIRAVIAGELLVYFRW